MNSTSASVSSCSLESYNTIKHNPRPLSRHNIIYCLIRRPESCGFRSAHGTHRCQQKQWRRRKRRIISVSVLYDDLTEGTSVLKARLTLLSEFERANMSFSEATFTPGTMPALVYTCVHDGSFSERRLVTRNMETETISSRRGDFWNFSRLRKRTF